MGTILVKGMMPKTVPDASIQTATITLSVWQETSPTRTSFSLNALRTSSKPGGSRFMTPMRRLNSQSLATSVEMRP